MIQVQFNEVIAGRAAHLSLALPRPRTLSEVPPEIRALTRIQSLFLGGTDIESIPSWLSELPNLEEIGINGSPVQKIPHLPNVGWGVDAHQLVILGDQLDVGKIRRMYIDPATPEQVLE